MPTSADPTARPAADPPAIRVALPFHLRTLAQVAGPEVALPVPPPVTLEAVLNALERCYPALRGTLREGPTGKRRPLIRFFACQQDWSDQSLTAELPAAVAAGAEPLLVVGAIAGG